MGWVLRLGTAFGTRRSDGLSRGTRPNSSAGGGLGCRPLKASFAGRGLCILRNHSSGGEAFGKIRMGVNVRLDRSHTHQDGGFGFTPMRIVHTRALAGLACLDTTAVGHDGRDGNWGSSLRPPDLGTGVV